VLPPMGASSSAPVFSSEELDVYEACTCLSAAEILELYDKFCKAGGERAPPTSHEKHLRGRRSDTPQPQRTDAEVGGEDAEGGKKAKIADIVKQKEFLYNPFAQRLCRIFTSEEDKESASFGDLDFDEFVDLYNALSPKAKKDTKIQTAFRLYDFDGDGYLNPADLKELLRLLTTPHSVQSGGVEGSPQTSFLAAETEEIVERVMRECDIDGNGRLSYAEFAKVLNRVPDFPAKFGIFLA